MGQPGSCALWAGFDSSEKADSLYSLSSPHQPGMASVNEQGGTQGISFT